MVKAEDAPKKEVFPRRYVDLVWLPVGTFLLAEAVLGLFAHKFAAGNGRTAAADWAEAAARMQLLGMALLFLLSGAAIILKFVGDIRLLFHDTTRVRILTVYFICVAAGATVVLSAYGGIVPRSFELIDAQMFQDAFANAAGMTGGRIWGKSVFNGLLGVVNAVTALAVPAFVAGGFSCLARFPALEDKENWIWQSGRLKTYLYMSTWFLVIGVLFLRTWIQYPQYLPSAETDKAAFAAFGSLVNAFSAYTGIEYSLVLAAYALPVAWVLSMRADTIAAKIVMTEKKLSSPPRTVPFNLEVQKVREREQLVITPVDALKATAALLAPLITGAFSSLAGTLS